MAIKVSSELKRLLDAQKKATGETLTQIIERAIAEKLDANKQMSRRHAEQEALSRQLHELANDLRQIVHKIDKIAAEQASDVGEALKVIIAGKKHQWHNHPQKEKIFQLVRDLHQVGANSTMIASALNLEGLKHFAGNGEWKAADVKKIITEIKKEGDYFPPLYSLPE